MMRSRLGALALLASTAICSGVHAQAADPWARGVAGAAVVAQTGINSANITPVIFGAPQTLAPAGVTLGPNQSLKCPSSGGKSQAPLLTYSGNVSAVTLSGQGSALQDCGITVGSSATSGVSMNGGSEANITVDGGFLTGGSATGNMVTILNTSGYRVSNEKIFRTAAGENGIFTNQSNDQFLFNNEIYGDDLFSPGTSDSGSSLVIDSGTNGLNVDWMLGGDSGTHGILIQHKANLSLGPPVQLDMAHTVSDCMLLGSGVLFDSTLTTSGLQATLAQPWAAGAGQQCNGNTTVITHNAHGIEVEGGSNLFIWGGRLRANTGAGYYDNSAGTGQAIALTQLVADGIYSAADTHSGAEFTGNATGFIAIANWASNSNDVSGGHEQYGVAVGNTTGYGIVTDNVCGTLDINGSTTLGCVQEGDAGKVSYWNNLSKPGQLDPYNKIFGQFLLASDNSRKVGLDLLPNYGSGPFSLTGALSNITYDPVGANFITATDGGSNGGAGWLFSNNNGVHSGLYVIPSTGGGAGQTVAPASLSTYQLVDFTGGIWRFVAGPQILGQIQIRNQADASQYIYIRAGSTTDQNEGIQYYNHSATQEWQDYMDSGDLYQITDSVNALNRLTLTAGGTTRIQSGGSSSVNINDGANSGTGGLAVFSGGATPANIFSIPANGNINWKNGADAAQLMTIQAGATTSENEGFRFYSQPGTEQFRVYLDSALNFHFTDIVTSSIDRVLLSVGAGTTINAAGSGAVLINGTANSGTGGFTVDGGGASPAQEFRVTASGAILMPNIASNTGAQTGTVCWAATGLTYDPSSTCLISDLRLKENVLPLGAALPEVMALRPISYDIKAKVNPALHAEGQQIGLGAQDVQKVDGRLVSLYSSGPDKGTPSGVRYQQMVALLVKAIQEQQAEIDALKARLATTLTVGPSSPLFLDTVSKEVPLTRLAIPADELKK